VIARVATDADADLLKDPLRYFRCAVPVEGQQFPPQYEMSVEYQIRYDLWRWRYDDPTVDDPRLLIVDSWDGIAAIAAHERSTEGVRQITVAAVSAELRKRGLGFQVLASALVDSADRCPDGRAYWYVHEDNRPCRWLSEVMVKADLVYDPGLIDDEDDLYGPDEVPSHHVLYAIDL
jgi:GNAT superfamily N-acetyltransferase